jgi:glucose-6-phosphate isomerase
MLLANALAQAELFATGRSAADLRDAGCPADLVAHKIMPGGRPTTVMIAERLDPRTLGALIAIYEHSVFTQGVLWGINSFDQWGVEYGKEVATSLIPALTGAQPPMDTMHPSTAASIALLMQLRD